jgi:hypothetical protein
MTAEGLYTANWPLAYEALVQGWLPPLDGTDYVAADGFFSSLGVNAVRFYDTSEDRASDEVGWLDGY